MLRCCPHTGNENVLYAGIISFKAILYLPPVIVAEYLLALSITMIVSAVTVYLRDLEHVLVIITMAWQFLTPVMYSIDMVPEQIQTIFHLNPMTPIIIAYRDILYYQKVPKLGTLTQGIIFSISNVLIQSSINSFGSLVMAMIPIIMLYFGNDVLKNKEISGMDFFRKIIIINIIFAVLSIRVGIFYRFIAYFSIFQIIWIPNMLKAMKKNRNEFKIVFATGFFMYWLLLMIYRPEWYGVVPYKIMNL